MKSRTIILTVLLIGFSIPSFAWWGLNGHRVVGEIADSYLTSRARKAIREILGTESIAMSSNWADFVKSDSAYNAYYSWHFINFKAGLTRDDIQKQLLQDTSVNAYTKLNFLISELKKKDLATDKKLMYLRFLIHIAGDIHQPLHVGRPEDLGANRIRVQWFNEPTNLHSIWDDKLLEHQKLSYTEYATAINHTTKEQRLEWQSQPMTEWFYESYEIAQKLYAGITEPDQKLGYRYNYDHLATMNQCLLKGGVRLAGILNDIFG